MIKNSNYFIPTHPTNMIINNNNKNRKKVEHLWSYINNHKLNSALLTKMEVGFWSDCCQGVEKQSLEGSKTVGF